MLDSLFTACALDHRVARLPQAARKIVSLEEVVLNEENNKRTRICR